MESWHIFSGFPSLGVLLQKLENPALQACLNVPSNEVFLLFFSLTAGVYYKPRDDCQLCPLQGVLVRRVETTSHASHVLKEVYQVRGIIHFDFFDKYICFSFPSGEQWE